MVDYKYVVPKVSPNFSLLIVGFVERQMFEFDATKIRNACKNTIKTEWQKDKIAKITCVL